MTGKRGRPPTPYRGKIIEMLREGKWTYSYIAWKFSVNITTVERLAKSEGIRTDIHSYERLLKLEQRKKAAKLANDRVKSILREKALSRIRASR
jgi:hypothetical protein